jgi:hypothetical protein
VQQAAPGSQATTDYHEGHRLAGSAPRFWYESLAASMSALRDDSLLT